MKNIGQSRAKIACVVLLVSGAMSCNRQAVSNGGNDKPLYDVILVTLDTTRADHLGCYGYSKPTSPNIDKFAKQGALFTQAIAQASVTPVSHASIMTGLNPYNHGLRVMHGLTENRLADKHVTIAERLGDMGYETGACVSAFPVTERFGLHQGFRYFDAEFLYGPPEKMISREGTVNTGKSQRPANETTDRAIAWLNQVESPYFLWLHYFDVHDPQVLPPQEFLNQYAPPQGSHRENLRTIYDIELTYMDQQLGRVFDWLEEKKQYDNTIVIVLADHGEGLGDHDWWTHGKLYQEQIRVPLIIRAPKVAAGQRIESLVSTVDIVPTLLDILGSKDADAASLDGHSLLSLLQNQERRDSPQVYSDSVNMLTYGFSKEIRDKKDDMYFSIIEGRWKYIYHVLHPEKSELFDLENDPHELINVSHVQPGIVKRLRQGIAERKSIPAKQLDSKSVMSPQDRARLESLGYLGH